MLSGSESRETPGESSRTSDPLGQTRGNGLPQGICILNFLDNPHYAGVATEAVQQALPNLAVCNKIDLSGESREMSAEEGNAVTESEKAATGDDVAESEDAEAEAGEGDDDGGAPMGADQATAPGDDVYRSSPAEN